MGNVNLRSVEKSYGDTKVIHGVDLEVANGEFIVFVGPSGCGKSSMLRMIAGLEDISDGEIYIGSKRVNDLPPSERGAAMVFQNYALYPHMTVAENMGFALKIAGQDKPQIKQAVNRAAEILHIEHLLERKPKALSGGERQRVAIGRAIVRKPKVFLFDEPLSNLDASLRVKMRLELSRLHRELGSTMIYVTHDQVEAMTMGERIVVFNKGRIEQVGAPLELYNNPANQFVAGFLGSPKMNFIPCRLSSVDMQKMTLRFDGNESLVFPGAVDVKAANEPLTLGIRPEYMAVVEPGQGLTATVDVLEHLGDAQILYARLPGTEQLIAVKLPDGHPPLKSGEVVGIAPNPKKFLLFDAKGRTLATQ